MSNLPNYYELLSVTSNATTEEIRTAYRKKSLEVHPDRLAPSATKQQREKANEDFSLIADSYFTLSDPVRRKSYDALLQSNSTQGSFFDYFGTKPDPDSVFSDVFEDMLKPELNKATGFPIYRILGTAAGVVIGFIAGNVVGAGVGALAGGKLGSVRDAKGKSVLEVYKDLGQSQRAEVLRVLAAKVFGLASNHLG